MAVKPTAKGSASSATKSGGAASQVSSTTATTKKENEGEKKSMALSITPVKLASLPAPVRGVPEGKPAVTITSNGQIRLSRPATRHLGGDNPAKQYAVVGWLGKAAKRQFAIQAIKEVPAELKDAYVPEMAVGSKSKSYQFSAGRVMAAFGYDYKASGNQIFDAKLEKDGEGDAIVVVTLPEGKLAARPVTPRKKKAAAAAAGANGATATTSTDDADEDVDIDEDGEDES